jgi:hypothetical protein
LGLSSSYASRAQASVDTWSCGGYYSAQTCWAGTGYQNYRAVLNQLYVTRYQVCGKGQTAAGNTRLGGGDGCGYNTTFRASCFGASSPASALYVYWAGSGQPTTDVGSGYHNGEYLPNQLCDGV